MWYEVRHNESIRDIAKRFGVAEKQIRQSNQVTTDVVGGQWLFIPANHDQFMTYMVQATDSLDRIAKRFGITSERIMDINDMASSGFFVGQTLVVDNPLGMNTQDISTRKVQIATYYDKTSRKQVPIWKVPGKTPFFFTSKMAVDADGSPRAYHPQDIGLDSISHARSGGRWYGVVTDRRGNPVIQKTNDPAPGYYVSSTSLMDCSKPDTDQRAYVNAEVIPYFVLPSNKTWAKVGDFGVVINTNNGRMAYAIFADTGPVNYLGEASIALANALGVNPDPRSGGEPDGVLYIVFPNSGAGPCKLRTVEEIIENGQRLFEQWGGMEQVKAVSPKKVRK